MENNERQQFEAMLKPSASETYTVWEVIDLMQKAYDLDRNSILKNSLFMDNASEALYETVCEGYVSFKMLVCEANDKDGNKYQLHIVAESNEKQFVDNDEEMPVFGIDEEYRLIELPPNPSNEERK